MQFPRRRLAAISVALLGLLALPAFAQEGYPQRPVKLIVPFAPGGSTDLVARLVAEKMQATLGQPVTRGIADRLPWVARPDEAAAALKAADLQSKEPIDAREVFTRK